MPHPSESTPQLFKKLLPIKNPSLPDKESWGSIIRQKTSLPFMRRRRVHAHRQVFWLPVTSILSFSTLRAFPSHWLIKITTSRDSGLVRISLPVTAAQPRGFLTLFPFKPHRTPIYFNQHSKEQMFYNTISKFFVKLDRLERSENFWIGVFKKMFIRKREENLRLIDSLREAI